MLQPLYQVKNLKEAQKEARFCYANKTEVTIKVSVVKNFAIFFSKLFMYAIKQVLWLFVEWRKSEEALEPCFRCPPGTATKLMIFQW